jgi:tyrosine-protein kinase
VSPTQPAAAPQPPSSFVRALRIARERWWVIGVAAIVCAAAAYAVSTTSTKEYEAKSKILFRNPGFSNALVGAEVFAPSIDPERDASTNVLLVKSNEVAEQVKKKLALETTTSDLLDNIDVQVEENADVAGIIAKDPDPAQAAKISDAFAEQYVLFRQQADRKKVADAETLLRQRRDSLPADETAERRELSGALQKLVALEAVQTGNAEVIDRASVPTSPSSPKPKRDAAIALIFGALLGTALAFVLDFFDRRVKSVEEFEEIYGLRALATVPQSAFVARGREGRTAAFEPYRVLSNTLGYLMRPQDGRIVLVTSAIDGEGKTSVSINLARAVALAGQPVALVETDLRQPSFARYFRFDETSPGLTTALVARQPAREFLRTISPTLRDLSVLPSGPLPPNPTELLQSGQMRDLLVELSSGGRWVILDAPLLLSIADAQVLLDHPQVDACLIVARAYRTTRDEARQARAIVDQHRLNPLGLVVTGAREAEGTYRYYGMTKGYGVEAWTRTGDGGPEPSPALDAERETSR